MKRRQKPGPKAEVVECVGCQARFESNPLRGTLSPGTVEYCPPCVQAIQQRIEEEEARKVKSLEASRRRRVKGIPKREMRGQSGFVKQTHTFNYGKRNTAPF